ncbi:MAG: pyruvate dehydrogenase (acetyl-transferring) E1 component subunit alpha [Candidatus Rokubacteria bacterium]|nr:pyruvate dehydrogenase (acetyl-transferring) E1 component subunit alpha [Candidatus Rokubacteria bacterium]
MPRGLIDVPEPIEFISVLDADGRVDKGLEPAIPPEDLRRLYRTMLHARKADERLLILQRQGRIGTALSGRGQEAAALGAVYALRPTDWLVPVFRQLPAFLWRGWALENLILYLAGYLEGMRLPEGCHDLALCVPVASQIPHAVGLAYAARYKGEDSVVLVFLGDGATSHGDFHEAMNFAGVFQVPVVFCCENNQWAISVPVAKQTRAKTLARKAGAYGMPGVQVDGNDLLAVYVGTREAVERARAGKGPTFIECLTYRLGPHSTADDPTKYRSEEEVKAWEAKEPLLRFRRYLEGKGLLGEAGHAALEAEVEAEIREAVERAEARMDGELLDVFTHVYAQLPAELNEQKEQLARFLDASPGEAQG